ncbi:50S ribosomal protein L9, partial [candidate division WOR-3 bacterium]|nr:50S ribosomal protein L9 [candidate division WOR-3 bacterium]
IKSLGVYSVSIKLHAEVQATVKLWVVSEAV